jgi:hypothetical protein
MDEINNNNNNNNVLVDLTCSSYITLLHFLSHTFNVPNIVYKALQDIPKNVVTTSTLLMSMINHC